MLNKPRAVVFDLGGTLVDDEYDSDARLRTMVQLAPREVDLHVYRKLATALGADLRKRRLESLLEHSVVAFMRLVGDHLGLDYPQSDEELELELWRASETCELVAGVEATIAMLHEARVALAIVSNVGFGNRVIEYELEKVGLRNCFCQIVTSNDYGIRKPHPAIFGGVAGRLGTAPEQCWFVGDDPEADVAGAMRTGMVGVWMNRRARECPDGLSPDAEVKDWQAFDQLWRRVSRG
jgi:HAD superfamily hydrolase (TIGR01549 family)